MKRHSFFAKRSPWGRFPCGPSDWADPQEYDAELVTVITVSDTELRQRFHVRFACMIALCRWYGCRF